MGTKLFSITLWALIVFLPARILAQRSTFTLSGFVKDKISGEMLAGATVQVAEQKSGVLTNSYGYYSLKLNPDTLLIRISYMGFQTLYHGLFLDHDSVMDYEILPQGVNLEEVLIESERPEDKLDQTQMSNTRISVETIKQIPAFLGEVDVLRVLQLMPGVQSGSEGSTGLYVRGGGQDQNLVLLDDAPVYNSSHLFGFFSIFNSDAISGVELFKGGFPAKYGGKLSSVLDIRMKEGNMKKYHVSGGLGLISSRLTIEGPIIKNKASFILSGRRTYIDLFTRLANKANEERSTYDPIPDYYFNDFNGKINFILGKRDRFFLSGYYGKDVMHYFSGKYTLDFDWGNTTGSLRWNHVFGDKLFLNTSLVYSNFNYNIDNEYTGYKAKIFSNIRDVNGRLDFDWFAGNKHYIKFGAQTIFHEVTPRGISGEVKSTDFSFSNVKTFQSLESGAYVSDDITVSPRIKANVGFRMSAYYVQNELYLNPEPRLSLLIKTTEKISLKASYSRMAQYIHLLSNSAIALPTDLWYPTTATVGPQKSDQVALGITTFPWKGIELSSEVFGKLYYNLSEFREGAQVFATGDFGNQLTFGRGWSYGWEVFAQKSVGKLTGWVGYTLSKTVRQFDSINYGDPYPNKYDRRHDVSIVMNWALSKRLSLGGTWVFGTGNAITLAVGRYFLMDVPEEGGSIIPDYLKRNSFRMPAYHRLDVGLTVNPKKANGHSHWVFSIFNLYNRRNTFFIFYETIDNRQGVPIKFQARQVSLFPMIPSVTWNFSF